MILQLKYTDFNKMKKQELQPERKHKPQREHEHERQHQHPPNPFPKGEASSQQHGFAFSSRNGLAMYTMAQMRHYKLRVVSPPPQTDQTGSVGGTHAGSQPRPGWISLEIRPGPAPQHAHYFSSNTHERPNHQSRHSDSTTAWQCP